MRGLPKGQPRLDQEYPKEPIENKIEIARPDGSQPLTLESGVKAILDRLEVVSNMLNRQIYHILTLKSSARTQGVITGFDIDQLVAEIRKVTQQIGTANRALFEAFENMVIDMHHFSTQMKGSTD